MDTYLYLALNTLFQELFASALSAPVSTTTNSSFQNLFLSAAGLTLPNGSSSTSLSPASMPESTPSSNVVQSAIQSAAAATGLSPNLLKAIATVESGLDPTAVSSAGAIGLMQLMPATAQSLGVNPDNTQQNALGGAEYLKSLLSQFGQNLSLALAAYNAGPEAVTQYGGIPPYAQTQQYVNDVLNAYRAYSSPPSSL
ncbi:MAG: lytic transglycosylase domain-containing protein [Sulfobacillus acidophilus]|uniref:Lytic transglycosylase domain-containing protein n=1 Tax=Sulfobacillus acidophilus TaxID=53633 RepID=A0A2T2WMC0_9FIRM|nr:MAG: lytic transglycosylase domain-containing protein [Sulfobacillus acidophilus]